MKKFGYSVEYVVTLPDDTSGILKDFIEANPGYEQDPENLEPQVVEGNMVAWMVQEWSAGGNYDQYVELYDNNIWETP
jgi:hypothetical protein